MDMWAGVHMYVDPWMYRCVCVGELHVCVHACGDKRNH